METENCVMDDILEELDLGHLKTTFKENKVGPQEVLVLTDDEFGFLGVTAIGDRANIRAKCNAYVLDGASASTVIQRLRNFQSKRTKGAWKGADSIRKRKTTRRIYMGWKHRASGYIFSLVSASKGGGQQIRDVHRDFTLQELVDFAKGVYFPQGENVASGRDAITMDFYLANFSGERLPTHIGDKAFTVDRYASVSGYPIRVYLHSYEKDRNDEDYSRSGATGATASASPAVRQAVSASGSYATAHASALTAVSARRPEATAHVDALEMDCSRSGATGATASASPAVREAVSASGSYATAHASALTAVSARRPAATAHVDALEMDYSRSGATGVTVSASPAVPEAVSASRSDATAHATSPAAVSVRRPDATAHVDALEVDFNDDLPDLLDLPNYDFSPIEDDCQLVEVMNVETQDRVQHETTEDVLRHLRLRIDVDGRRNVINVVRENVIDGARRGFRRATFRDTHLINVRFSGESGIDDGGPTREFMRLTVKQLRDSKLFEGPEDEKTLATDVVAEAEEEYKLAGHILAYIIVHGGPAPQFLSECAFSCLVGHPTCLLSDIVDRTTRNRVTAIANAADEAEFLLAAEQMADIIDFIGAVPLQRFCKKQQLVDALVLHLVYTRKKAAFEQFAEGLGCLGVFKELRRKELLLKHLFIANNRQLDALEVELLFETAFSEEGSNRRQRELRTHTHWRDLLQDLEEDNKLEDLLVFVTGLDGIPPLGFDPPLKVTFDHPEDDTNEHARGIPYANTCANWLHIPILSEYEVFKQRMLLAFAVGVSFTDN